MDKILVANWKMNKTLQGGIEWTRKVVGNVSNHASSMQIILVPAYIYLYTLHKIISSRRNVFLGAQNCHTHHFGAFTGEISASMLYSIGVKYVLIGHSERREYAKEDNVLLSKKITAALQNHLYPIFCCGENWSIRKSNRHIQFIKNQITEGLFHLSQEQLKKVIIAYEPIWAIGTGATPTILDIETIYTTIYDLIVDKYNKSVASTIPLLYGGSCSAHNIQLICSCKYVSGVLIGGASLEVDDFIEVMNALALS